jgi:hypothetical protein
MLRLASKKTKSAQGENTARTLLKIPTSNYQTSISQIATKREKKKNKKRQIPRPSRGGLRRDDDARTRKYAPR